VEKSFCQKKSVAISEKQQSLLSCKPVCSNFIEVSFFVSQGQYEFQEKNRNFQLPSRKVNLPTFLTKIVRLGCVRNNEKLFLKKRKKKQNLF